MYSKGDKYRICKEPASTLSQEGYRSEWRRDIARLIHSPSFRRLQGKTQLFPTQESDFFRNRLTHSLEVAQIAKSIAIRLNNTSLKSKDYKIEEDICEFAGLAHDLGHPPFGHQGENALDECMADIGGFEGNAQTLRILTKLEKKVIPADEECDSYKNRFGLNLTTRSLGSILKYDRKIPTNKMDRPEKWRDKSMKGFYSTEEAVVKTIKDKIILNKSSKKLKTVECQIMDIADDIAYSTYDLEDGFKASFLQPLDIMFANDNVLERTREKVNNAVSEELSIEDIRDYLFEIFESIFIFDEDPEDLEEISKHDYAVMKSSIAFQTSKKIASDGYHRTAFTSRRVGEAIRNITLKIDEDNPVLSTVELDSNLRIKIEILKHYVYESQIDSPKLKISEYRGKQIVKEIFSFLIEADGFKILPNDYQMLYHCTEFENEKYRIIGDFIAGMTDRYCSEFYYRIKSEHPKTIFKPF